MNKEFLRGCKETLDVVFNMYAKYKSQKKMGKFVRDMKEMIEDTNEILGSVKA